MSQAKVEQYKKDKANRKQIMKKEKAKRMAGKACAWLVLLALVGWAGYSVFSYYRAQIPEKSIYADLSAISDYLDGLRSENSEAGTESATE